MDRLTLDCIAAQKAGMTYGKWKALHPCTEEGIAETPKKEVKLCQNCGKEMSNCYKGRLYCGEECAYEAKMERAREFRQRKKERMMASGKV